MTGPVASPLNKKRGNPIMFITGSNHRSRRGFAATGAPRPLQILLLSTILTAPLFAQTSEISGRIVDSSNGVVSGAKVTLTRADTGLRRTTLSSEEGYYHLPLLASGTYDIQAEREGFQRRMRTGVVVETGVNSVVDLQLE